jgi:hypothetical protein
VKISPIGQGNVVQPDTNPQDKRSGMAATWLIQLLNDLRLAGQKVGNSGTTAQRPIDPLLGELYYDTTLNSLVMCTATRVAATNTPAVWSPVSSSAIATTYTVAGTYTFTQPIGYSQLTGELQAPGGGYTGAGGGAPGGGEYLRFSVPCPAGTSVTVTLGAPVSGAAGQSVTISFLGYTITALGGPANSGSTAGSGAGRKGPAGTTGAGTDAVQEGVDSTSGASGGGGTGTNNGGGCEEWSGGVGVLNRGGGGASKNGPGGVGAAAGTPATPQGYGGGSGTGAVAGIGAPGFAKLLQQ